MDDLRKSLDAFADSLVRECNAIASVEIRIDVFKAVSAYYLGCNRVGAAKAKANGKDDDVMTFDSLVEKLGKATEETGDAGETP